MSFAYISCLCQLSTTIYNMYTSCTIVIAPPIAYMLIMLAIGALSTILLLICIGSISPIHRNNKVSPYCAAVLFEKTGIIHMPEDGEVMSP